MSILFGFFGFWDLMIIAIIAMLLFGNRLPSMMHTLGQGPDWWFPPCPFCGWRSIHPTHCRHCGQPKCGSVLEEQRLGAEESMEHGQPRVHLPSWLITLIVLSCVAWAADLIWGQWSLRDAQWTGWLHWTTLALVAISLVALTAIAIVAHFRSREQRNG
jgi:hypothetical protein